MIKQCIICENWFDTKDRGSRAITCSDGCSKKRKRKLNQERYQNDPDCRERERKRRQERYRYHREQERRQERYQNDPDYRERELKYKREWRSKVKKHGFMKAIEMVKKISKKLSEEEKGES